MKNLDVNSIGVILLVCAVAIFSLQNVSTKLMSDYFATHEILFLRAILMLPIVFIIAYVTTELNTLRTKFYFRHMARSLALFVGFSGFFLGLSGLPLANSIAIFFSSPLFVTLLSVIILGERIGIHRTVALCVGFIGVLVMVRPGFGDFNYATIFPLAGAIGYSFMPILTRSLSTTESASAMIFYNALFSILFASIVGLILGTGAYTLGTLGDPSYFLTRPWVWPTGVEWSWFAFLGLTSAVGSYLAAQAYRTATTSVVTPFEYTALLWATLWGFLIWGDIPDSLTFLGMVLVVGSGLYIVAREARLNQKKGKIVGNG